MDHLFHPLFTVQTGTASQLQAYVISKQRELSLMEGQMLTTNRLAFDSAYSSQLKDHIHTILSSTELIHSQMKELLSYLNEDSLFPQKSFSFLGTTYHSHIDSQAYFLYSQFGYDAFLEKQMFAIIELDIKEKKKEIRSCSIGFTAEKVISLLQYPMDLQHELEKFEMLQSIEESLAHVTYCQQCVLSYFGVDDILALYEIEQSNLLKYIGDPLVLLRTIQKKHNDNRIKISLRSALPHPINKATIELIHMERRVIKQEQLRRFWGEEQFTAYAKQLQQTKNRLMEAAGVSQKQLDCLMAQMPADFL